MKLIKIFAFIFFLIPLTLKANSQTIHRPGSAPSLLLIAKRFSDHIHNNFLKSEEIKEKADKKNSSDLTPNKDSYVQTKNDQKRGHELRKLLVEQRASIYSENTNASTVVEDELIELAENPLQTVDLETSGRKIIASFLDETNPSSHEVASTFWNGQSPTLTVYGKGTETEATPAQHVDAGAQTVEQISTDVLVLSRNHNITPRNSPKLSKDQNFHSIVLGSCERTSASSETCDCETQTEIQMEDKATGLPLRFLPSKNLESESNVSSDSHPNALLQTSSCVPLEPLGNKEESAINAMSQNSDETICAMKIEFEKRGANESLLNFDADAEEMLKRTKNHHANLNKAQKVAVYMYTIKGLCSKFMEVQLLEAQNKASLFKEFPVFLTVLSSAITCLDSHERNSGTRTQRPLYRGLHVQKFTGCLRLTVISLSENRKVALDFCKKDSILLIIN